MASALVRCPEADDPPVPTGAPVTREMLIAEVQAATPGVDVGAVLGKPGRASLSEVRSDLARAGVDQAEIDKLIPPDAV
jgi:hypothetical protein